MYEQLEVTDHGIMSCPALADTAWFRNTHPAFQRSAHAMKTIQTTRGYYEVASLQQNY